MPSLVHLALVVAAPRVERPLEFLDRLGGHALIIGGVADVKPRLQPRQDEMRTVERVGEQSTAVERRDGGDAIGTRRRNAQRDLASEAEPDDAYRSAGDEWLRRQEIDVGRSVARHRAGGERSLELGKALLRALAREIRLERKDRRLGD